MESEDFDRTESHDHEDDMEVRGLVRACVRVCVRACVRACVCACVCVRVCVCSRARVCNISSSSGDLPVPVERTPAKSALGRMLERCSRQSLLEQGTRTGGRLVSEYYM